jgi:hypothetical protein
MRIRKFPFSSRPALLAFVCAACVTQAASVVNAADSTTLTIDARARVQDTALLDGEFAHWNYGASPYLEAGRMMGIYAEHNAVSLIRFDLSGVRAGKITRARLLVYKPRSFSQLQPVNISVHEVGQRNRGWRQGGGFADAVDDGASWSRIDAARAWAGETGASLIGMDHVIPALNTQPARDDAGHWMAFELPIALIERWLAQPETNAGLRLSLSPSGRAPRWGDHVYFRSSEHFLGDGPRLELEGTGLSQGKTPAVANGNLPFCLPGKDAAFLRWGKSRSRMAGFARDINMNSDQTLLFYYFDTEVREKLVNARYRGPITQLLPRLDAAIQSNDEAGMRACLDEFREKLLIWESIREILWYTAGPLADHLTSDQLAKLYTQSMWQRLEDKSNAKVRERAVERGEDPESARGVWEPIKGEALAERQQQVLQRIIDATRPDERQIAEIAPTIREFVRLENEHLTHFNRFLDETRLHAEGRAQQGAGDVWDSFRLMNHHHEAFLYYQSLFNTPRWHFLGEKTPPLGWARWILQVGKRYGLSEKQMEALKQTQSK